MPFQLIDLEHFIEELRLSTFLYLHETMILTGTWAEGLEILRGKKKFRQFGTFERPLGAEYLELSGVEYGEIFGRTKGNSIYGNGSKADDFMRGHTGENPLVKIGPLQNEGSDET